MFIPRKKELIDIARVMRKKGTKEENHLWYDYLNSYSPRFYRQKIIGGYVADFYCDAAKLVVEIDGSQHYTPEGKSKDTERMNYMKSLGIETLRFSNTDISFTFDGVCIAIDHAVKAKINIEE